MKEVLRQGLQYLRNNNGTVPITSFGYVFQGMSDSILTELEQVGFIKVDGSLVVLIKGE